MKRLLKRIAFLTAIFVHSISVAQLKTAEAPLSIGKQITIQSEELNEERLLNVYLPDSYYTDSVKSYPVIYLLDGSVDEDFLHIAGLVQFCSFSWINVIPETIVVGISNIDRKRDFTYPSSVEQDQQEFPTSGKSEAFIRFIEKELQPFIESEFRVENQKTIIGQSLGGLLATEILLKRPDLFDKYIIASPSLWWDNGALLNVQLKEKNLEPSIYIAVGKEGELMEKMAKNLHKKLLNYDAEKEDLFFNFLGEKSHVDVLHQAVYDAFEYFKVKK